MTGVRRALRAALRSYLRLLAIVAPTYAAVVVFKHSPALPWTVAHLEPAMRWFGLPGEAALPVVLGATINLYAAIAACAGLALSAGHMTTLGLVLGFAHNLIVEGMLVWRLSTRALLWIGLRLAAAVAAGVLLGPTFARLWPAPAGLGAAAAAVAPGAADAGAIGREIAVGGGRMALLILAINVPIVFTLGLLQAAGALARLRAPLRPALRALGLEERASEALLAGVFFGLVYGAGVILDRVREEGLGEAQVGRLCLIFVLCHAIVEDTLLFAPFGAALAPIVAVRVAAALAGTATLSLVTRAAARESRQAA